MSYEEILEAVKAYIDIVKKREDNSWHIYWKVLIYHGMPHNEV
jgi:hypothetical protein